MNNNNEKRKDEQFWREMAGEMQDALRLRPLTPEEAADAYEQAPDELLPDDEVEHLVEAALRQVPKEESYEERIGRAAEQGTLAEEVGEVIGFNRNGDGDKFSPEVEEEMRRGREEADRKEREERDAAESDKEH